MNKTLSSPTAELVSRLQIAAIYHTSVARLHRIGICTGIFGLFLCIMALSWYRHPLALVELLLTGCWMIWFGRSIFRRALVPQLTFIERVFAVILVLNIGLFVYESHFVVGTSRQLAPSGVGLPILLIVWLFFIFIYKHFRRRIPSIPNAEDLAQIEQLMAKFHSNSPEAQDSIITFAIKQDRKRYYYKGQLNSEIGIFVNHRDGDVILLPKSDIVISTEPPLTHKGMLNVSFQFARETYFGAMTAVSFERYQQWKSSY